MPSVWVKNGRGVALHQAVCSNMYVVCWQVGSRKSKKLKDRKKERKHIEEGPDQSGDAATPATEPKKKGKKRHRDNAGEEGERTKP